MQDVYGRRMNAMGVLNKGLALAAAGSLAWMLLAVAGCSKGNPAAPSSLVKVYIYDSGTALDDRFEALVDGVSLGQTSTGSIRKFEGNLESGSHTLRVVWTAGPDSVGTYGVYLVGAKFSNGGTASDGYIWSTGGNKEWEIAVP